MASITREDVKRLEDKAYDDGWRDGQKAGAKKSGKSKATKVLLWIITGLFAGAFGLCFAAWVFKGSYPEQLIDIAFKVFSLIGGGFVVKSGAENYGKITHAEEYNRNYPDA